MSEINKDALRRSGRILVDTLAAIAQKLEPGVTTKQLDELAEDCIRSHGGIPAFLGHRGFPGTLCTSVNEQVVHGIPSAYELRDGDIVSIDLGVKVEGWYTDSAVTLGVGEVSPAASRLMEVTAEALEVAVNQARAGNRTGDLGAAVQAYVEQAGFNVVRDCVGHGIGQALHQDPSIPNYGKRGTGSVFTEDLVVAIEPMVVIGEAEVEVADDHWTVHTRDRSLAAHFEETVIITSGEPERLTPLDGLTNRLPGQKSDGRLGRVA